MRRKFVPIAAGGLLFVTLACSALNNLPVFHPSHPASDGEISTNEAPDSDATAFAQASCAAEVCDGAVPYTYWLQNPQSGARLFVQVVHPYNWNDERIETLVLVPGGIGTIDLRQARQLADAGFTVVVFDPDGRGESEGQEDLNGPVHQDGLAAVIRAAKEFPGVDPERIGLVSFADGVMMSSGALARHPDLAVRFLMDWEGPADRSDTTLDCSMEANNPWPSCEDNEAWLEREAIAFLPRLSVPYQRLQSEIDHVQPDLDHAVKLVEAAVQGGTPLVRLNEATITQPLDPLALPEMLPHKANSNLDTLIPLYAQQLFSLTSPAVTSNP